jgi:hypothetical protein
VLANWRQVIADLRIAARRRAIVLPDRYIVDGRWHSAQNGSGAYLMFPNHPFLALLDCDANDDGPQLWQPHDRMLSWALRRRITEAIASRPKLISQSRLVAWHFHDGAYSSIHTQKPDDVRAQMLEQRVDEARQSQPQLEPQIPAVHAMASSAAARFLIDVLREGPVPATQIRADASGAGHSWATVRRAAIAMGVKPKKYGFGPGGRWCWALKAAQATSDVTVAKVGQGIPQESPKGHPRRTRRSPGGLA